MSHGKIREDKTCLNCGHQVEERFCPHCGQENTERRQPFYFLFTHFVEDFTHYDGQFWGTVKNLIFKPGKLTNIYLEGKRQTFVPPVKLYIFVSFITFFMFALFPMVLFNSDSNKGGTLDKAAIIKNIKPADTQKLIDSIKARKNLTKEDSLAIKSLQVLPDSAKIEDFAKILEMDKKIDSNSGFGNYKTRKSYDSAMAKNPSFLDFIQIPIAHKFFELKDNGVKKEEIVTSMVEKSFHNLPKALFIYLPIFAFFLWIFHNKKKWWYFDHGIFTLHYFSFLLLIILLIFLISKLTGLSGFKMINALLYLIMSLLTLYSMGYFFIAHRRVYHSHGLVSLIIGMILFTINFIAFMFLVVGLALISFLMIH
ncbi:hypothetical protein DRF65_09625 [Chryseobacterium pennae]|uniref:DUF3667 domain-containing protein n=1 Tax=Chryseobacterium pennae TaxID=2258962 RepID=A0A3D9C9Z4_9FLAO|nr:MULTISPECIES: DUF3667 domain-containing protein [Chryseobacterium]MCS4303816.1 hypothetical protein [Chryseobacterium sp. BIGb0232]REC62693.1 hypothetical protein DRF65_09625 [Chryseobacterium pennae]ROS11645.1 uncharacterized protein DUF3667 [Chryseobacterium nakagawai]